MAEEKKFELREPKYIKLNDIRPKSAGFNVYAKV